MEITGDDLKLMNIFASVAGVMPTDMSKVGDSYVFLVEKFSLGKAIGKKGANIQKLRQRLKTNVMIAPDDEDLEAFVRGYFNNIRVLDFEVREAPGQKAVFLTVADTDRGLAIGKGGLRIKAMKDFLKRKFGAEIHLKTKRTDF